MVITCSDTRTPDTDSSGNCVMHMLKDAGHSVVAYHLVRDEPSKIKAKIKAAVTNKKIHAIIINGGTGISKRDSTFEAVDAMLEKRLVGFGEVFRYLTYQEIGSPAIMSRAEDWLETLDQETGARVTLPGFERGAPPLAVQLDLP